jgi:hypothetical protein
MGNASRAAYTSSESNNICIGTNIQGILGESNVIHISSNSHNNLYIRNRAMYKSARGNYSFGSALSATGTANSVFGSRALTTLIT